MLTLSLCLLSRTGPRAAKSLACSLTGSHQGDILRCDPGAGSGATVRLIRRELISVRGDEPAKSGELHVEVPRSRVVQTGRDSAGTDENKSDGPQASGSKIGRGG